MIARRRHGWIGIDFGARLAKIAQLERVGDRLRWNRSTVPCSQGGGLTCTGKELARALQTDGGFRGRVVACVLPPSSVELRALSVPPGSDTERRAMIAQELETALPGEHDAREFAFWQPGVGGQTSENDAVQVASVATAKVAELTKSLADAGLECAVLDALPCALARAIDLAQTAPAEGPSAAIDWGYASATVSIVNGGATQFTRPLRDCGAGALFREIGQALGLEEDEAVELLTRFGLPGTADERDEELEVHEVVMDVAGIHVQCMLDELSRTFAFLRSQRQGLVPRRAWLFGAGATVKNAAAFLAAKLEIACDVWRLAGCEETGTQAASHPIFGPAAALSALGWKR